MNDRNINRKIKEFPGVPYGIQDKYEAPKCKKECSIARKWPLGDETTPR